MSHRALSERALIVLLAAVTAAGPLALSLYVPAAPLARADFGVSLAAASTTVSAPLIAFAFGLFAHGPLSDRYGRRPLILAGLCVYLVGTALAGFAPSIGLLTLGRIVTALGAAAGVTVTRAVIGDLYPHEGMANRLATLTMVMVIVNALAPATGGMLAEALGWRSVFGLLFTIGAITLLASWRLMPETRRAGDVAGGRQIAHATMTLLREPRFLACAFQSAVIYGGFFVFVALIPHVFKSLGRTATEYGLWYVGISCGYFLGNGVVIRYATRIGAHRLLTTGILIQAVAALLGWVFALKGLWHPFWIFSPWFVIVFGQGLALPNLTANAVALAPRYAGAAAGLLGFIQQILGAIAVQAMATSSTATPIPVTAFVAGAALLAWITLKLGPRPGG